MLPPLFVAVGNHDAAAARQLLADGADPNAWSPLHGQSLLFTASEVEDLALVRMLLEHGADPNQRLTIRPHGMSCEDVTVLMYAPTAEIASALIEYGADVNAQDKNGTTALMNAVLRGRIDVLQVLLDAGAIVTTRQKVRRKATALDLAVNQLSLWEARRHRPGPYRPNTVAARIECHQKIVSLLSTTTTAAPPHH